MKFEDTEVFNFNGAIRGMRNAMNSWDKSDSYPRFFDKKDFEDAMKNKEINPDCDFELNDTNEAIITNYVIGKNDLALAQKLIRAGSEHRKFMRQIFVCVDITASLYWWKEFDTYKVGTVANSTSTMHKICANPITIDCFETDDIQDFEIKGLKKDIKKCEKYRQKYLKTKMKVFWKALIRKLPESWLQKRTVTMDYENLLAMCSKGQRRFHKLNEWSGIDNDVLPNFISWARTLPYAQELLFLDELEE